MSKKEVWKDVVGYEGLYQVSNLGRVRSFERKGTFTKIKVQETVKGGYKRVNLYKNGRLKKMLVHRLVAEAFLGTPDKDMQVNHINGIVDDNRLENLEWVTVKENANHKTTVLNKKPRGVYRAGKYGWSAQIVFNQKKINLGVFKNKQDAYKVFYQKYIELRGVPPWDLKIFKTH